MLPRPAPQLRGTDPDREKVLRQFAPALLLKGAPEKGALLVSTLCLPCHYVQGHGQRVGPDLSSLASKTPEMLLTDILDPGRQVAPDYQTYEVELPDGERLTGLISSETETRLTLRFAGSPDVSVAKVKNLKWRATGKSLMPDGLESGLSHQDAADILAFLKQPNGDWLK